MVLLGGHSILYIVLCNKLTVYPSRMVLALYHPWENQESTTLGIIRKIHIIFVEFNSSYELASCTSRMVLALYYP